jgi:RimJ/RimL family protein N-acetyltransferase
VAQEADAQFLMDLRNRLAEHFFSPEPATLEKTLELLGLRLGYGNSSTYILMVDGRRVGSYALYNWDGRTTVEFGRFMLDPDEHGNGYGRMMLEHAIVKAWAMGAHRLSLVTKPANVAACELYGEAGFEVTQVRMELSLD